METPLCFRELELCLRGDAHSGRPSSKALLLPVPLLGVAPQRVFAASNAKTGTRPIGLKTYLNQNRCTSISEIQTGSDLCVSTSVDSCPLGFHTQYV